MKRHPDITPVELLRRLTTGEYLPRAVDADGRERPTSDLDRLEGHAHLVEVAQIPANIRTKCIGCEADVAILDTAACVCGAFVCQACQQREPDGVCPHEPRTVTRVNGGPPPPTTMRQAWRTFRREALSGPIAAEDDDFYEQLFFAGAVGCFGLVARALELEPHEARVERLHAIRDELHQWSQRQTGRPQ